jgi:hypothetical protein
MSEDEIDKKIEEWESSINTEMKPKLKYPIKIIESDILKVNIEFIEPSIEPPKKNIRKSPSQSFKIVDIAKKKNKNKKLF